LRIDTRLRDNMVLLASIDQGTSSTRFLIFDSTNGELLASHQIEVTQLFPQPGWVEMDPDEIYSTVVECIELACHELSKSGRNPNDICAIGISNQRETTVVWDKITGKSLHNAIVWLDNRTSFLAEELIQRTANCDKDFLKPKTGLPIHPYFSALKLKWLIENVPDVQTALNNGSLMVGTVDSWLLWKLCNGVYVTDVTNASRTCLMDLHTRKWSTELCSFFGIPIDILPEIRSSAEIYGHLNSGCLEGKQISGCLGDQQAALVGHNCLNSGDTKSTYGTGTFVLCNTGTNIVYSSSGLLTTIAFQFGPNASVHFALEGSGSIGGNVVKFLMDNFGFFKRASDIESLARSVESTEDTYFVPCFSGLLTPYWDPLARGTICGISQRTTQAHICLAALKSVAFQTVEIIEAIEKDITGTNMISNLRIDGGMTANCFFNQILADALGRQVLCSKFTEVTGWGAAIAAGLGGGVISVEPFPRHTAEIKLHHPGNSDETRNVELRKWREAVRRSGNWAICTH